MYNPSQDSLNFLIESFQKGNFFYTEKFALKIIKKFPNHNFAWRVLASLFMQQKREAEALFANLRVVELMPEDASERNNLGIIQLGLDKLKDAELTFKKSIEINPYFTEAKFNLANTLHKLGRKEEARNYYLQTLELSPNHFAANLNLGVTLLELNKIKDSEIFFRKCTNLKPDLSISYNYLGYIQYELNKLNESFFSFLKAIEIKPDYEEAWSNIYYPIKLIKFSEIKTLNILAGLLPKGDNLDFSMRMSVLDYKLNIGKKIAKQYYDKAINSLSKKKNNIIKNPKKKENSFKPKPKKVIGLLHFGRSGSGLLHSLIDNHSEVMTLPSIYFSEFFDLDTWNELIEGGWEEIVDRFMSYYPVFFDSRSTHPVASIKKGKIKGLGILEGMTSLGENKKDYLHLDKSLFKKELYALMSKYSRLDQLTFFYLVHYAYEKLINNNQSKKTILYHIHNPDICTKLNFSNLAPATKWIITVREPVDNLESWICKRFFENKYYEVACSIKAMLFEIDNIFFLDKDVIGVKLEDLKGNPEKTISLLCKWIGIKKEKSLFDMTAQGKKWWGDKSSSHMPKFGRVSKIKKGKVFSDNDRFIFNTLFYPFSVKFGYQKADLNSFKRDLKLIEPLIKNIFDFEKKIADRIEMDYKHFMQLGSYKYLRESLIERWKLLSKLNTYPNMFNPLK